MSRGAPNVSCALGEGYIGRAFRLTRAADPAARLVYKGNTTRLGGGSTNDSLWLFEMPVDAAECRLAIQQMADGRYHDVDGIMVFMPPGSAKSAYTSVIAPSWLLGRKPGTNVLGQAWEAMRDDAYKALGDDIPLWDAAKPIKYKENNCVLLR